MVNQVIYHVPAFALINLHLDQIFVNVALQQVKLSESSGMSNNFGMLINSNAEQWIYIGIGDIIMSLFNNRLFWKHIIYIM